MKYKKMKMPFISYLKRFKIMMLHNVLTKVSKSKQKNYVFIKCFHREQKPVSMAYDELN